MMQHTQLNMWIYNGTILGKFYISVTTSNVTEFVNCKFIFPFKSRQFLFFKNGLLKIFFMQILLMICKKNKKTKPKNSLASTAADFYPV